VVPSTYWEKVTPLSFSVIFPDTISELNIPPFIWLNPRWLKADRASTAATPQYDVPRRVTSSLADFTAVTVDEVTKLISSAPNKTCQLDPAPTWLVKDMSGLLSPIIALLINKSLTTGCFPAEFKEAIVRPLLREMDLTSPT